MASLMQQKPYFQHIDISSNNNSTKREHLIRLYSVVEIFQMKEIHTNFSLNIPRNNMNLSGNAKRK